jgi:hypothetical protein
MTDAEVQVRAIWMNQSREESSPALDEIRVRAERFDSKTKRWRSSGLIAGIAVVAVNVVEAVWPGQHVLERTGSLLTIAAVIYIAREYRTHARLLSRPDARALTSCVDFYRAQLVHERTLASQSRRYLLPFVPGVALSIIGGLVAQGTTTAHLIVAAALGVTLFLSIAWLNACTARKLQREIDRLDAP